MYKNAYFYSTIRTYIDGVNLMNSAEKITYLEEIQELKNQNLAYQSEINTYQKRCEQYMQAYEQLQHQLKEFMRNRFGKKSERFIDPEHPQFSLFGDDEKFSTANAAGEALSEEEIQIPAHSRKKKNTAKKELPRRIEIIPLSEEEKICSCGECKEVISYETKESIHYEPAVFEILEQRREVAVCPKGCDGSIITAPAPLHVLPKIKATEEFLSFLVVSKLDDRQPFYHLEKQLNERHGVDCSRQTMARWMIDLMVPLQPIYNLMKDYVIEYDAASCDATTLQVLNEPGRPPETKSYVYCIRGGPPDKSVILYDYNDKLHKQFIKDWFEGFHGYLHVDGDNFFDLIGEIANLVNCNAHARRKFEPISQGAKGKGLAKEAMRFFKELYKIEREAKNNNLTPEQRHELRQQKSKPLMEKFKIWLDELYPTVLPKSPLGLAMSYCINRWPGLTRFLDDGRLEIDNNLTEQEIKPIVIARKNFLFCYSVDGARALCMHFSFVRTAKLHGHDPYHYYVKLLKGIPHCNSVEDYEKLLPWNLKSDYIKQD
jgi:transposase